MIKKKKNKQKSKEKINPPPKIIKVLNIMFKEVLIGLIVGMILYFILTYSYSKPDLKMSIEQKDFLKEILTEEGFSTKEEALNFAQNNLTGEESIFFREYIEMMENTSKYEIMMTLSNSNKGIAFVKRMYVEILNYSIADYCGTIGVPALSDIYAAYVSLGKDSKYVEITDFKLIQGEVYSSKPLIPLFEYKEGELDVFYISFYPWEEYNMEESIFYWIKINVVWCNLREECKERILSSKPIKITFFKNCSD